jgi:hypothetical protein
MLARVAAVSAKIIHPVSEEQVISRVGNCGSGWAAHLFQPLTRYDNSFVFVLCCIYSDAIGFGLTLESSCYSGRVEKIHTMAGANCYYLALLWV